MHSRETICNISLAIGIPQPTIHWLVMKTRSKGHKKLKPYLTEKHITLQVLFANKFIKDKGMFDNMLDYVHIDEKQFFLIVNGDYYCLTLKEELYFVFVQHKNHIIKVVCLATVACPCFDTKRRCMWDGKLGI